MAGTVGAMVLLMAVVAGGARAALLVHEPFDYAAGTVLDATEASGLNLTGMYTALGPAAAQKIVVSTPGLDYGHMIGVPAATGGRANDLMGVTAAGATVSLDTQVLVEPGSTIYWSALFTFDDSENGNRLANITFRNDENGEVLSFGESVAGVQAIRVSADTVATGGLVATGADGSFVNGHTLLLVGRYVNSVAAGGDRLDLVGYDTANAHVLPPLFDPTDANAEFAYALTGLDIDFERITSITFLIRGDDNNFIDELRIGSTYGAVIAEPATASVGLLASVLITTLARSRRGLRLLAIHD